MRLPPLRPATLIRRYQRFLADIAWPDGTVTTVHTPNTGSMRQCINVGARVLVSHSDNAKRKYPWTLELIEVDGHWVDTNTQRSNKVVAEALQLNTIAGLQGFDVYPEKKLGASRIDFLLEKEGQRLWLEVKNVTLMITRACAGFPDAVTERGRRHLRELMAAIDQGDQAAVFFLVQRPEAQLFAAAAEIDPDYAEQLAMAMAHGVGAYACQCETDEEQTRIVRRLPVMI